MWEVQPPYDPCESFRPRHSFFFSTCLNKNLWILVVEETPNPESFAEKKCRKRERVFLGVVLRGMPEEQFLQRITLGFRV